MQRLGQVGHRYCESGIQGKVKAQRKLGELSDVNSALSHRI